MLYKLILPDSYYRESIGIFNDTTEDTKDTGHVIHINFTL